MHLMTNDEIREKADKHVNDFIENYKKVNGKLPSKLECVQVRLDILYHLNTEQKIALERLNNEIKIC